MMYKVNGIRINFFIDHTLERTSILILKIIGQYQAGEEDLNWIAGRNYDHCDYSSSSYVLM